MSQSDLCNKSVEISNQFYKNDYKGFVFELEKLKYEANVDKHLIEIIDFNIARGLFYQEKYLESQAVLNHLLENQNADFKDFFKCDKSVFVDDYEVENVFSGLSSYWLMINAYKLLSDSNYFLGNYSEALLNLEDYIETKNEKKPFYTCGVALEGDVLQFEHRKFNILRKLDKIEDSNISAMNILMLTSNKDLINQVKEDLLTNHSKKEIKQEFKNNFKNLNKISTKIAGIEYVLFEFL